MGAKSCSARNLLASCFVRAFGRVGDDFSSPARYKVLDYIVRKKSVWYDIKVRGRLGPGPRYLKSIRMLNRMIRWEKDRLAYEWDDKHAHTVISSMGLYNNSKGADSPLPFEHEEQPEDDLLAPEEAREYRRVAAVAAYAALDRPDMQFATGGLGRTASRPTVISAGNQKRVARFSSPTHRVDARTPTGRSVASRAEA